MYIMNLPGNKKKPNLKWLICNIHMIYLYDNVLNLPLVLTRALRKVKQWNLNVFFTSSAEGWNWILVTTRILRIFVIWICAIWYIIDNLSWCFQIQILAEISLHFPYRILVLTLFWLPLVIVNNNYVTPNPSKTIFNMWMSPGMITYSFWIIFLVPPQHSSVIIKPTTS